VPNSDPFRGFVPLNEWGEVEIDCSCRTGVPGVFAAGDVTAVPYKQIVIAAGDGAKAALSCHDGLLRRGKGQQGGPAHDPVQ
jgi:alkyl hydroperoxide reductase subunit F